MRTSDIYFHLHTNSMNPCSLSRQSAEIAKTTWLCLGCNYPKNDETVIDVTIQDRPEDSPLNFCYGFGIPIATRKFLQSFGESVYRDLHLGRVFLENGNQMTDWVTFRGKSRLIIRGVKNISHRVCDECHRNVYFAMGSRYLCPAPSSDRDLFESDLSGLIVSKVMFDRIELKKWPKLVVDRLPSLSSPKDGLASLLWSSGSNH